MTINKETKHFPVLITICFALNFLLGITGGGFEMFSKGQALTWASANLLYISGCILYSMLLADEKQFISASGFILLGIGEGIFYVEQNKLRMQLGYDDYMLGILAILPGMIFLLWHKGFPLWLRIFNLAAYAPFFIAMIMMLNEKYDFKRDWAIDGTGFFMTNVAALIWSYYAFRTARNNSHEKNE